MPSLETTARSRELGALLRARRRSRRITGTLLARRLGWGDTKLSRIETGKCAVSEVEITHHLAACGASFEEIAELLAFWRRTQGNEGHWLISHAPHASESVRSLIYHESTADSMSVYEPRLVHGLLQTEEYARAVITSVYSSTPGEIEAAVRNRLDRRAVLRKDHVQHEFFLHENAVRFPIGNNSIMHEQMLHLVFTASAPNVTIRIVPASDERSLLGGPFRILNFDGHRPLIYLDGYVSGTFLEDQDLVAFHRDLAGDVARVALDAGQSREFLADLADSFDRVRGPAHARHQVAHQ